MSYYSDRGSMCPGKIDGDALDGLYNRVAISVKRILDSCRRQVTIENTHLELINIPPGAKPPFVFVGAVSSRVTAFITGLDITRIDERSFSRVKCTVTVPMQVTFSDADNKKLSADSKIEIYQDVVLYVPEASIFPFEITASASCTCPSGRFEDGCCIVTACLTVIEKVVADTDLLVPAYGYCAAPNAVDFEDQTCNKFFDLPLYPSGNGR